VCAVISSGCGTCSFQGLHKPFRVENNNREKHCDHLLAYKETMKGMKVIITEEMKKR
jgi:hypothetical protein